MNGAAHSDTTSVLIECDLEERPETVWRALTTPEIVAEWLGPNTMAREPEGGFEVRLPPEEGGVVACEILEASPPECLSYAWRLSDPGLPGAVLDTVVTFTLTPSRLGGTHLRVVHSGLTLGLIARRNVVATMSSGRSLGELRPLRTFGRRGSQRTARMSPVHYGQVTQLHLAA